MKKKQRLYFILFILVSLGLATGLALYAMKDNISYFYSPSEVVEFKAEGSTMVAAGRKFRMGGLVKEGSLKKRSADMKISFVMTDMVKEIKVTYTGILPDLFREGQAVIAHGALDGSIFAATELLAKHDEKYMPSEVAKSLEAAAKAKKGK